MITQDLDKPPSLDLTDALVYERGVPHERFAYLRRTSPVYWHEEEPPNHGFWALTRYDDIQKVNRDASTFSSAAGFVTLEEPSPEAMDARRSLVESDRPEHTRLRRLVSPLFTPPAIAQWRDQSRALADELLDATLPRGRFDWAVDFCEPLPLRLFIKMMGLDDVDADLLQGLANQLGFMDDPELAPPPEAFERARQRGYDPRHLPFGSPASLDLFDLGRRLAEQRRENPKDDLVTRLIQAEWDGDRLSESEFLNFFQLLIFGGNETTRTSMQQGMLALIEHPDQLELVRRDPELVKQAVEEILRWTTPFYYMRRTAMDDTDIGGQAIRKGDKVVMWYVAGNFDEDVFDEPYRFDVTRQGPRHLSFGGGGPHFCLGAALARMQLEVMLEQFLARDVRLELTGPVARLRSNFTNGMKRMPVRVAATVE